MAGTAPTRSVVAALDRDWEQLVAARPGPVAPAELEAVLEAAAQGCDATLHRLLLAAQGGDALAARTVLQSLLGRLVRMAARDPHAGVDDYVAHAWCVLTRYPLAARPVRIAANLTLDTLKEVLRERRGWRVRGSAEWVAGDRLVPLVEEDQVRTRWSGEQGRSAREVIAAGRRLRLIDEPAGRLLEHVYLEGLSGADAARRASSTPGSVRVRCSRAVQVLAAHADQLAEVA